MPKATGQKQAPARGRGGRQGKRILRGAPHQGVRATRGKLHAEPPLELRDDHRNERGVDLDEPDDVGAPSGEPLFDDVGELGEHRVLAGGEAVGCGCNHAHVEGGGPERRGIGARGHAEEESAEKLGPRRVPG